MFRMHFFKLPQRNNLLKNRSIALTALKQNRFQDSTGHQKLMLTPYSTY